MDLFHRYRNKFYAIIRQWYSDGLLESDKGKEREEAYETAKKFLVHYSDKNIAERTFNDEKYCFSSLEDFSPELPFLFTALEKKYLKTLLNNEIFRNFIDADMVDILTEYLVDVGEFPLEDFFQNMAECQADFSFEHTENVLLLYQGIVEKRMVSFDYRGTDGDFYENQELFPFRLMYDKEFGMWQLLSFTKKEKEEVICNLERMGKVTLTEEWFSEDLQTLLETNREDNILKLRLKKDSNSYNAIERCFLLFHDYQCTPDYDSKKEEYYLSISYHKKWDSEDLLSKVLSLGSAVEVLEPLAFREDIINELRLMLL